MTINTETCQANESHEYPGSYGHRTCHDVRLTDRPNKKLLYRVKIKHWIVNLHRLDWG